MMTLGLAVVEHEGDGFRIQPGVQRELSTAPAIGTPKCASTMGGVFGSITATVSFLPIPAPTKRTGQLAAAGVGFAPGAAQRDHARPPVAVGVDLRRALDET
jgi:hypothetical protein